TPLQPTQTRFRLDSISFPGPAGSGWCVEQQPRTDQQRFLRSLLLGKTVSRETPIEEIMHTYVLWVAVVSHEFLRDPANEAEPVRFTQRWVDLGAVIELPLSGQARLADHDVGTGESVVDSRVWPENGHGAPCVRLHIVTRQIGNQYAPDKVLTQPGE